MEQEGDGRRGGDMNKQPQDRRLKEIEQGDGQVQVQVQPQPQHPQKCPRCDSLNTKFCYYNNYSLTQPRYFCKTCRRYWTQGGTLRNVPVGGGCRKGKRAKNSSSSSSSDNSSRSQPLPPPQKAQPALTMVARAEDPSSVVASPSLAAPSIAPFYQGGGGYLSSLAAMNQLNPPSHPYDQSLNVGGDVVRSSNLGLLSGFNVASLGSQRQIRPSQFYQVGSGGRDQVVSLYASEQGLIPSSMANTSAATHHDWPQSFINNNTGNRASDASLWSTISTTSIGGGNSDRSAAAGSNPLVPNHWPDLPGFHPPS